MKKSILSIVLFFALISLSFKAGKELTITQPNLPKSTIIFHSMDCQSAVEKTKKYVKLGYIVKSFNLADDQNTGSDWVNIVVVLEKY